MFAFFRKRRASDCRTLPVGKLEISYETYREKYEKKSAGRLYDLNIGEMVGDLVKNNIIPVRLYHLVRNVLDDYLKAESDFYFAIEECILGVCFSNTNKTVAELKMQVIRNELARVIAEEKRRSKMQESGEEDILQDDPEDMPVQHKICGTLSEAPDIKEMKGWASRALANMTVGNGYADLQADADKLADIVKMKYEPVWYAENEIIPGYICGTTARLFTENYSGQKAQEDFAVLASTCRQLKLMRERQEYSIFVLPVNVSTLCEKNTRDLYNIYSKGISKELRRFIVIMFRGLLEKDLSAHDWDYIRTIGGNFRSVIADTEGKHIPPGEFEGIRFGSFGFDISRAGSLEDKLVDMTKAYADFYKKI